MPHRLPILLGEQSHDLAHLDPMVICTPSTKLRRDIVTRCRFTSHTFTRIPRKGEAGPFFMDEGNRPRLFCPERYALSLHLPAAMRQLERPEHYVTETASERNWLHRSVVSLQIDPAHVMTYQVFFGVRKARRADDFDVEMTVESAYALDPARPPAVRGRMQIVGVLTAAIEARTPHTQG